MDRRLRAQGTPFPPSLLPGWGVKRSLRGLKAPRRRCPHKPANGVMAQAPEPPQPNGLRDGGAATQNGPASSLTVGLVSVCGGSSFVCLVVCLLQCLFACQTFPKNHHFQAVHSIQDGETLFSLCSCLLSFYIPFFFLDDQTASVFFRVGMFQVCIPRLWCLAFRPRQVLWGGGLCFAPSAQKGSKCWEGGLFYQHSVCGKIPAIKEAVLPENSASSVPANLPGAGKFFLA